MQIIIRRMTLLDLVVNILYKFRFWFIRNFIPSVLVYESPEQKDGRVLTFKDDFDVISWSGKGDGTKWKYGEHWGQFHPDHPHQYHTYPQLERGYSLARFYAQYEPYTFPDDFKTGEPITINHQTSLLSSKKSFQQQYGRFECRCTIPFFVGTWPAWWMWAQHGEKGSKTYTEIDIHELYGKKDGKNAGIQCINLHYHTEPEIWQSMKAWKVKVQKDPDKLRLHEFAMEWTPNKIEVITDGIKIFRFTRKDVLEYFNKPDQKMWLVINNGIDPKYINPDDNKYKSEFYVDYIRAYRY